ncbi:hypothetical protein DFH07DRAFT_1032063 [Mycena maculata]|uniref:Uncharacterized protein n=1 Tax=Mycena maculata TaxID=230809 RepID=A0AAD7IXM1_9AGAR|nr:hypothetical protein DFH07DRAFT_1032063 [Mycena maculata]
MKYWRPTRTFKASSAGTFASESLCPNTSFPPLIISDTADPITPGMHGSPVAPSLCTYGAMATYFQHGTLPVPGTAVDDAELFPTANSSANAGVQQRGELRD